MISSIKFPFYAKATLLIIGVYVFTSILSLIQDILLPVIYATLIAILISPVVAFLVKHKVKRVIAIALVLLLALLILASLFILLSTQASRLREAWPQLVEKFQNFIRISISWTSSYFDISAQKINSGIATLQKEVFSNSNAAIGITITTMGGVLSTVFLTPVYIFMILFYQEHLLNFIHQLFDKSFGEQIGQVLMQTKSIIRSYLVGLFGEFVIVAILNSIGLLILGIDYAILLGIMGAFLNIIPYLGGIIAMGIMMIIALITKSPEYVIYVAILYTAIQLIDNNFIVPKIVGSKVKLNALISLLVVIAGAALWGIPGMFLSIPLTAILKVIFDHIESLKSLGFLLGNDELIVNKSIYKKN